MKYSERSNRRFHQSSSSYPSRTARSRNRIPSLIRTGDFWQPQIDAYLVSRHHYFAGNSYAHRTISRFLKGCFHVRLVAVRVKSTSTIGCNCSWEGRAINLHWADTSVNAKGACSIDTWRKMDPEIVSKDFRGRRGNWRGRFEIRVILWRNMTGNLFELKRPGKLLTYVKSMLIICCILSFTDSRVYGVRADDRNITSCHNERRSPTFYLTLLYFSPFARSTRHARVRRTERMELQRKKSGAYDRETRLRDRIRVIPQCRKPFWVRAKANKAFAAGWSCDPRRAEKYENSEGCEWLKRVWIIPRTSTPRTIRN